jgi:nucleotide-binding universal stress UspA family protein
VTSVLVPTDFSVNSKAGLRFAISWSLRQNIRLIFFYVFHPIIPPLSTKTEIDISVDQGMTSYKIRLNKFVLSLYASLKVEPGKYSCVVRQGNSADLSIMDYCREKGNINYICIATHGAGSLNKIFGTNTGNLITKSDVPVLSIPPKYRRHNHRVLLFPTDLPDSDKNLEHVVSFARPLGIRIKIINFSFTDNDFPEKDAIQTTLRRKFRYDNMELHIKKAILRLSLRENIQEYIRVTKPSIVAIATNQNRTLFQKLFYPSRAEQLSFTSSIPILTFPTSGSLFSDNTVKRRLLNE